MRPPMQTTLRRAVTLAGRGVHTDATATVCIHPAPAGHGIRFVRTGLPGGSRRNLAARWANVSATDLCTVLGDPSRGSVSTVEHLMGALSGLGVDNASIEVDGPEVPILDGSAAPFVVAIDRAGLVRLGVGRGHVEVLRTVRVERGRAYAELSPGTGFSLDVTIDFPSPAIGRQRKVVELSPAAFRKDLARARTFGMVSDVERLWAKGLALGSSLENSVAIDGCRILNPEGLRQPDEFVSHKILDAVGDLALAGAPLRGRFTAFCPGHGLNALLLQALLSDPSAHAVRDGMPARRTGLPGHATPGIAAAIA